VYNLLYIIILKKIYDNKSSTTDFIAGALAGGTATIVTYPFDFLRTRFTVQPATQPIYPNIFNGVIHIAKNEGISEFYRGIAPTLISTIPMMGIQFCIYEYLKASIVNIKGKTNIFDHMFCGAVAGGFSQLFYLLM